jgi:NAD(P)-dependent dehydrogenase (short-subunit alcohol dehydrogenase family)
MSDRFDLSGRIALVTGATRGRGRAMALALADAGADVVVSSRKADACETVARRSSAAGAGRSHIRATWAIGTRSPASSTPRTSACDLDRGSGRRDRAALMFIVLNDASSHETSCTLHIFDAY